MAGGWSRDGAVQDQIDDTVTDAVRGARARIPVGKGLECCEDCGEPSQLGGAKYWRVYAPALLAKRNAIKPSSIRRSTGGAAKIASCDEDSLAGQS